MSKDHPNFRRCYDEGAASVGTGDANPYVPGTDEAKFFDAGVKGENFHDEKKTDVSSEPVTLIDSGEPTKV